MAHRDLSANIIKIGAFSRLFATAAAEVIAPRLLLLDFDAAFPSASRKFLVVALLAEGFPSGFVQEAGALHVDNESCSGWALWCGRSVWPFYAGSVSLPDEPRLVHGGDGPGRPLSSGVPPPPQRRLSASMRRGLYAWIALGSPIGTRRPGLPVAGCSCTEKCKAFVLTHAEAVELAEQLRGQLQERARSGEAMRSF